jgi:ATP-dependent RNA helicase DDX10/DBP4
VGKHHSLSAGLLIGGKKEFLSEQSRVGGMALLVCTPGRLLQHLEQTPDFDPSSLQVNGGRFKEKKRKQW